MKKQIKKRLLSMILATVMLLTNISLEELTVLAQPTETSTEITVDPLSTHVPKTNHHNDD